LAEIPEFRTFQFSMNGYYEAGGVRVFVVGLISPSIGGMSREGCRIAAFAFCWFSNGSFLPRDKARFFKLTSDHEAVLAHTRTGGIGGRGRLSFSSASPGSGWRAAIYQLLRGKT
jgi:hypothetical protein